MALYEIVIGNSMDDRNYSKLVLSNEPINIDNARSIHKLCDYTGEYIYSVSIPCIMINAYDEEEFNELKNKLT